VVVGPAGGGAAVLLRGAAVLGGEATVIARRGRPAGLGLADGPGKLCQALAIDRDLDGVRIRGSAAELLSGVAVASIAVTSRIGITKAADWPLRFVAA
jgi:DNA-3-methyladenine glycosylase